MKFQYRDLDSFIHPNFKNSDLKFVQRFETTKLSDDEFLELKTTVPTKDSLVCVHLLMKLKWLKKSLIMNMIS